MDHLLAAHCAPALAGIKPASLVSCQRSQFPQLSRQLEEYRRAFAPKDVHFRILCACSKRYLLLVYRRRLLEQCLAQEKVVTLLEQFGYRREESLETKLDRLARRAAGQGRFPHEIGLFLGYPVEDSSAMAVRAVSCAAVGRYMAMCPVPPDSLPGLPRCAAPVCGG